MFLQLDPRLSEAIRAALQKWAPRFQEVVPYALKVEVADVSAGGAEIDVRVRYREAKMKVSADMLGYAEAEAELFVVHELCHLLTAPLHVELARLAKAAAPDAATKKILSDRVEDLIEGLTEDIAKITLRAAKPT